jgi:hypothetical protein
MTGWMMLTLKIKLTAMGGLEGEHWQNPASFRRDGTGGKRYPLFPKTLAVKTLALAIGKSVKKNVSSSETAYSAAGGK